MVWSLPPPNHGAAAGQLTKSAWTSLRACLLLCASSRSGGSTAFALQDRGVAAGTLCYKLHSAAHFLYLLLCQLGEELSLHQHWLLWKVTLSKNLEDSIFGHINDCCLLLVLGCLFPCLNSQRLRKAIFFIICKPILLMALYLVLKMAVLQAWIIRKRHRAAFGHARNIMLDKDEVPRGL